MNFEKLIRDKIIPSRNASIFIQSYPNLINVLTLLKEGSFYEKIHIYVVDNMDLHTLLKKITSHSFKDHAKVFFYKNISFDVRNPFNILKNRVYINSILSNLNIYKNDVYFSSIGFTTFGFTLIKKVSNPTNNLIHFSDPGCDVYDLKDRKPKNLKELVLLLIHRFIYGNELSLGDVGRKLNREYFFKISENFLKKQVNLSIDKIIRKKIQFNISISDFSFFKKTNFKVVYFDKDMIRDSLCQPETYKLNISKVFEIISKYCKSNELIRKYKPMRSTDNNKKIINYGLIADDYIPAEMLYSNKVKIYIGITSMAMSNIKSGIIISIVNLINFKDDNKKNRSILNLEKRKKVKHIFYPHNLNEFESLIKKYI